MALTPDVVSIPSIVLTAVLAALLAYGLLRSMAWELRERDAVGLSVHVGLAIWALRFFGNIPALNEDFLPAVSANDVLGFAAPLVAALVYWVYWPLGGKRLPARRAWRWGLLLGLIGFVANVVMI